MKKYSIALLLLLSVLIVLPSAAKNKTRVIAHRGYWKTEGSAQNSITSLQKAAEIKVYGSEFDMHLTKDDVPVIFHDNKIQGKVIQETNYSELKDLKLANGETLPTLQQYLDKAKTLKKIKLIFEIKPHATPERDCEAAAAAYNAVKDANLLKRTEFISFSKKTCEEIHRLAPKTPIYYLNGDLNPQALKDMGLTGLDYEYNKMKKNPEWYAQCKALKLKVNVWTVDTLEKMQDVISNGADFITTNEPVVAKNFLSSAK